MSDRQRNALIVTFAFSMVLLIVGMLLLITACHGECGSDVHGGMLTYVCTRFFCPQSISISMTVVGAIGMIVSSCFLIICAKSREK